MSDTRECAFTGCGPIDGRPRRGLCRPHYEQQRRGEPLTAEPRKWRKGAKAGAVCAFDGCGKPVQSVGLCGGHYAQRKKGQELVPLRTMQPRGLVCSFDSCDRPYFTAGVCTGHYAQRSAGKELAPLRERRLTTVRDEDGRKQCRQCDGWKSESDFTSSKHAADGLSNSCKRCVRDEYLRRQYNITANEYDAMAAAQGGVCAICKQIDPTGQELAVDHDHACCPDPGKSCGKCVRKLLCWPCNTGIGHFRDNPALLTAAAAYLAA